MHLRGEGLNRNAIPEVVADVFDRLVQVQVGLQKRLSCLITVGGAHESNHPAVRIADWKFVGHKPVWDSLTVEEQFDQIKSRFSSTQHGFIVRAEDFGEAAWEKFKIVPAEDLCFVLESKALEKQAAGADDFAFSVFCEKRNVV